MEIQGLRLYSDVILGLLAAILAFAVIAAGLLCFSIYPGTVYSNSLNAMLSGYIIFSKATFELQMFLTV